MFSARSSLLLAALLLLGTFAATPLKAQLRVKANPYSFRAALDAAVPTYRLPSERVQRAYQRYQQTANNPFILGADQHGLDVPVDLGFDNAGRWQTLPDGGHLWRLRIASDEATSLNLLYDTFWLPPGAQLFLYNEDRSVVLGAFTEANNKSYGGFATDIVPGNATILEYYEPADVTEPGRLHIANVIHGLLGGNPQQQLAGPYTPLALSCSINVACSEGSGWSREIGATVKIVLGSGMCTGVLVNNTEEDEMPYVLTANHCGHATAGQSVNWVFKFNYQSDTCADPAETPSSLGSITGGTVRAAIGGGADFTLIELSEGIPEDFGAYFAGWTLSESTPSSGTVIGHPKGDIKKITLDDDAVLHSGGYWESYLDHGTIESSSSGSPLFDQNNRLRGILRASLYLDENSCSGPGDDDNQPRILFPKLSVIWDMGNAGERLSDFLDPQGTGSTSVGSLQATGQNLPVEFVSFEAMLDGTAATLTWETASETNNAGFEIQRISKNDGASPRWEVLGFVEGHGTTLEAKSYTYRVDYLEAGRHRFRLKQVDYDGTFEYSPEVEVSVGVPGAYHLSSAYPNPFNPETSFSLSVARSQEVDIAVYNMLGQRVAHLYDGFLESETTRAFTFEAGGLPSGLYLIRIVGERFTDTHTVTLLK